MNKEEFILNIRPANGEPSKEYVMRLNTKLLLENEQLQQKVNQLETNRDEALKTTKELYEEGVEWHWDNGSLEMYVLDLLSILERGKE